MNTQLRLSKPTKQSWLKSFLLTLPFLFAAVSQVNAQCAGPYQFFEGVPTGYSNPVATGLAANGWTNNVQGVSSAAANHSGLRAVTMNSTARYVQSPLLANPGTFSFWFKATTVTGYNFRVEHSTDINMTSPISLGNYVAAGTIGWTKVTIDLAGAFVPANSYVRISANSAATMFFDDFAHISSDPTENTIIVPETGAASCSVQLLSGVTYTFYDNGGASDNHSVSQNMNITLIPASGEQVKLTYLSFVSGTTGSIGTMGLTNTDDPLSPTTPFTHTGNTIPNNPDNVYMGTGADVNVGVTYTTTTGTISATTTGFVITVESVPPVVTCGNPTSVSVPAAQIQATQANVTFTPPGVAPSNGYQYYLQATATPAPTAATTPSGSGAGSPLTMSPLAPNTTYYVWVRSDCGSGTYGNWVMAAAPFTTKCSPYPLPYTEDFNGLNGPLPTCTSNDIPGSYSTNIINGNLFTATEGATFFTKPVTLNAGTVYRLSFDYGTINGIADFDVNYGRTNFTPTVLNINNTINMYSGVSTLSTGMYNFTPAASGTHYVGFTLQGVGNPGSTQFNLDNIRIEEETCFPPTALTVPAGTITATGATVNWTPPALVPSNGYQYYISTSSTVPEYSTPPTGFVAAGNSISLSGLTSGTTYYIWVRSNCAGRYSVWSSYAQFQTLVVVVTTVNMSTGTTNMNCNNIYNFFDSGGSAASYANFEDFTRTFVPGAGKKVKVAFSAFSTEANWDALSVYNGPTAIEANRISSGLPVGFNAATCPAGSYYGTNSPGTIISTAANGELTFRFTSDFIIISSGWAATVTCVTAPRISDFTPLNNNCLPGTIVTINGSNFSGAGVPPVTGVFFGGIPAVSWTVNSATQITATLPAGATTGVIRVVNSEAYGVSPTEFQVFAPAPTTTGVTICAGGSGSLSTSSTCTGFNQVTNSITGTLTAGVDPVAPRPQTFTANSPICSFAGVTSNYVGIQFQVSATGVYNFEMSASPAVDGMAYITTGAFTPGSCGTGTYIVGDDDSGPGVYPAMSVTLTAGVTYTLYTTVWGSSSTTASTNFTWSVSSPGGGTALLYSNALMQWYTVATGGSPIGSGTTFNPVGVAGSGLPNTNTPGTYNFYAGCSSNPNCRTLTTFVIEPIPAGGTVSANQTICSGTTPANITLTGSAGTIQWQSSPDGTTWTNISPGGNAATLLGATIGPLTSTRYFRANLTTTTCGSATSPTVTVTVNPVSVAGTITPATTTVCTGTNSTLLTLAGNTGTIQWQSSPDNSTWTNINLATASTYTATNLTATTYYRAVVTSGVCPPANTASVVINVSPASVAGSITPASTGVCSGTNSTLLTLAGNTGAVQWQSSPDNSTWTNLGVTTSTYTATNLVATTYYRAVITSSPCGPVNTASVVVTVSPTPVAGTAASGQSICPGNAPANMTLSGYTGTIQWQSSPDGSTWADITPGGNAATLLGSTVGALASTTYFRAVVSSGSCTPVNSNTITVTVTPAVGGTASPASQTTCSALSDLTLAGSVGTITEWQWATDAIFTTPNSIPASASATLSASQFGTFSGTRYFRAVVGSGLCTTYSNVVSVTFNSTTWNGIWSNGVPNNTTAAIFAADYTMTGNLSACSVRILSGADVVVNPGVVFTVQNGVDVNAGGTLTFENTSSLLQVDDAAVNTGFVTYKRTTTGMSMFDYTYWSSPLFPQTLFGVSPLTLSDKYFEFSTAANNYVQLNSNNLMVPGKGYIIRAPQGWPSAPVTQQYTAVFNGGAGDGVPNNGVITIPIVSAGANVMNLLGNPYPSALVADAFMIANSSVIDGTMYFWTHNTPITANNYTGSDYAIYNLAAGVGTAPATNPGINNATPNGFVAAGQGFFVKSLANGTAVYNNSMRSGNNTQFFRPAGGHGTPGGIEKNRMWLELVNDLGAYKQSVVGYIESATNERDWGLDSDMVDAGNVVNLYSIMGTDKLAIQSRSLPFDVYDQVPIGYKTVYAGTYQIKLSAFDGFFENQVVYLEDKLLNVIHDLKAGPYTFVTNSGVFDERFVLRYTNSSLGVGHDVFNENSVIVYRNTTGLNIEASNAMIKAVKIFDVRGRLLAEKDNIGATTYQFANLPETQQVLLVKVVSESGAVVTKKVVY